MAEFKGTPGPWVVEDNEYVMDEYGHCIGAFGGIVNTDKDNANAILCAAAPELLEALHLFANEDVMAQINGNEFEEAVDDEEWVSFRFIAKDFRRAADAISKALGE